MATISRWHYDIDFKAPDGMLDMWQTLSYFHKEDAEREKNDLVTNILRNGCRDVKPYLREVKMYWPCTHPEEQL